MLLPVFEIAADLGRGLMRRGIKEVPRISTQCRHLLALSD